ncbi:MAG: 50S ribosomal protein L32 [Planctomycetota bacterium]
MANPKRRHSNMRTRKRRSHHALKAPSLTRCPRCNYLMMPHKICLNCEHYKSVEYRIKRPERASK